MEQSRAAPFFFQKFYQLGPKFWDRSNGPSRPHSTETLVKHLNRSKNSSREKILPQGVCQKPTKPGPTRRAALPLVPTTAKGRIAQKLREKEDTLSLKMRSKTSCASLLLSPTFWSFLKEEEDHYLDFCPFPHLNFSINTNYVLLFPDLIFGTISAVHFHHFSTHTTHGTRVRVICDFRCIEIRFTAPEMRCPVKRADSDCLRILRNFTC